MGSIVHFDQSHRPHRTINDVGEAFRRSLDLADLAEGFREAAAALNRAADAVDRMHWRPDVDARPEIEAAGVAVRALLEAVK